MPADSTAPYHLAREPPALDRVVSSGNANERMWCIDLSEPKMIHIDPDSELGRHLAGAADQPIVLESNGERYRLMHEGRNDVWVNYDPEAVRRTVARFVGSITPEEGERLKTELYRAREVRFSAPNRP